MTVDVRNSDDITARRLAQSFQSMLLLAVLSNELKYDSNDSVSGALTRNAKGYRSNDTGAFSSKLESKKSEAPR